jgi:hypothetical protein
VARRPPAIVAALAVVLLAVSVSGCLSVFPAKSLLSNDPRASSVEYGNILAYERKADPTMIGCEDGTDVRGVYVPERSEFATVSVFIRITPAQGVDQFIGRHFDLTVEDGTGEAWVEVHETAGDLLKDFRIDGPRPGGWTVTLSYRICEFDNAPFRIDDQLKVQMIVREPV